MSSIHLSDDIHHIFPLFRWIDALHNLLIVHSFMELQMPHIVVHLSGEPDAHLTRKTVDVVAELTQSVLGKQLPVIAITVQYIAADTWFIGGQSLASLGKSAFHLDISITDETNTKAEKARYLREVHAAMARLRPNLHEVSYIHVIDARGAAYGYGGKTQEYRHQQAGV
jgi:4-oxalocrotonate tautomerase